MRNTIRWIEESSLVLRAMILDGEVGIVGAMCDVATGQARFFDEGIGSPSDRATQRPHPDGGASAPSARSRSASP